MKRFAIGLAMVLSLASGASAQPVKVALGYTAVVDWLGAFVAKDKGIFEKHGLDVSLHLMSNGGVIPPGLLADSLQIGGITGPVIIQTAAAGFPLKVVSGASVATKANPNGWIIVRAGAGIKTPADFKGKHVAAGALGGYYNVLFREWLRKNGVDPGSVHFVEVSFGQISDVMKAGQIDAATIGQPFADRMVAAGIGSKLSAYTSDFPDGLLSNVYIATSPWLAQHPSGARDFQTAIAEADKAIAADPQDARTIAARYLKLPADAMKGLPLANYESTLTPAQIMQWSAMMLSQKQIDENIDPSKVLLQ